MGCSTYGRSTAALMVVGWWCSGVWGWGIGKRMKGMGCGAICSAQAHARTRAGDLQRARHRDGEVAAARLGQDGVARGGSSSARGGRSRGLWGRHVRRQRSRRWPGQAPSGGRRGADCRRREAEEQAGGRRNVDCFMKPENSRDPTIKQQ